QFLLGLGVDLAEHDVLVLARGLLVHRCEGPTRPAPLGPEVDKLDALAGNSVGEGVLGQFHDGHSRCLLDARRGSRSDTPLGITGRGSAVFRRHRSAFRTTTPFAARVVGRLPVSRFTAPNGTAEPSSTGLSVWLSRKWYRCDSELRHTTSIPLNASVEARDGHTTAGRTASPRTFSMSGP